MISRTCMGRALAGGQPFHTAEVNAYLLRVPHSLRGWQRVRILTFSNSLC
jgi:hypothetical protein